MAINDSETQAIFLCFWMKKFVDYFDLRRQEKKTKLINQYIDKSVVFLTCSTRSPPASRTNA